MPPHTSAFLLYESGNPSPLFRTYVHTTEVLIISYFL